jgi:dethiobiotin synthetase
MGKQIFITGTDTGVGKTTVSKSLSFILKKKGLSVGYFKPVETGCKERCEDAYSLSKITNQNLEEILCYSFKEPVAPLVAERMENQKMDLEKIKRQFENLKLKYEYLIVEGAGGVLVPITKDNGKIYTYLDLIKIFDIPSLIVSRAGLGTINHTALTVEVMKNSDIKIKGIIINGFSRNPDIAEKTNPQIIEEMTKIPVIGKILKTQFPFEEGVNSLKNCIEIIF